MSGRDSHKYTLTLTPEQAGPFPVSTESLWFDVVAGGLRLRNIPFFVDGLALDDIVTLHALDDGTWALDRVVRPSGNSTVWIHLDEGRQRPWLDALARRTGCRFEGGVIAHYYALNVPPDTDFAALCAALDEAQESGEVLVDYPCVRHPACD